MRHSCFHICLQNSSLKYEKLIDHFILDHNTWISLDKVWFKRNVVHHISGNPGYLGTGAFSYGLQTADRLALGSLPHPAIWMLYDQEGEPINHLSVPCAFEQQMESVDFWGMQVVLTCVLVWVLFFSLAVLAQVMCLRQCSKNATKRLLRCTFKHLSMEWSPGASPRPQASN